MLPANRLSEVAKLGVGGGKGSKVSVLFPSGQFARSPGVFDGSPANSQSFVRLCTANDNHDC